MLWFDVEEKGNTTAFSLAAPAPMLWFDVEEKGNTTKAFRQVQIHRCGLM